MRCSSQHDLLDVTMTGLSEQACAGVRWDYYYSFWFTVLLPVLFGIGHLLWVGIGYAWMKLVGRRSAFGGMLHLSCFIANAEEFRESWMQSFSNWLALLVILYNALCTLLFQAFMCTQLPDGTYVLQVDPDQVSNHISLLQIMHFSPDKLCSG